MKTHRTKTETGVTNYYICTENYHFFAVRKEGKFWRAVAYKAEKLYTDDYICTVETGFVSKTEAMDYLKCRIKEVPTGFYHSI